MPAPNWLSESSGGDDVSDSDESGLAEVGSEGTVRPRLPAPFSRGSGCP